MIVCYVILRRQNYFKQPNKKNRFIFQKYIYFAVLFSKNKNVF